MGRRPWWLCIAALLACSQAKGKEERSMGEVLGPDARTQCLGRFCLTVPASMVRGSDEYKVQGVALEEVSWAPAPAGQSPFEREWLSRLAKVEALKERRELPNDKHGTIVEQRAFVPGTFKGVLFNAGPTASLVTWGAILDAGKAGLWLQIPTGLKNKEVAAERVMTVGRGYHVADPGATPPKGAFHMAAGHVLLPFSLSERAQAHWRGHPWKLDLEVRYETTFEPQKTGLVERFASALSVSGAAALGAGIRPIRQGKRKVAGISGEEMVLKTNENGQEGLSFVWMYPGEEGSGTLPDMSIELDAPGGEDRDAKLAFWDALLASVKRAP